MNSHGHLLLVAGLLWSALALAQQAADQSTQGGISSPTQSAMQPLSRDDLDPESIRKVQIALNDAGYNAGTVDGIWGNRTDQALRDFQQARQLEVNGRLDENTILALGFSRDDFASAGPQPVLAQSDVRQVQEALNKAGYSVGSVDGVWGPATESALRDFQQSKGIDVTGKLNHDTVLALGLSTSEFAAGEFQEQGDVQQEGSQ